MKTIVDIFIYTLTRVAEIFRALCALPSLDINL